jgi:hypothetical protein
MTVLGDTPPPTPAGHPLVRVVDALEAVLDDAGAANAWTLSPAELQTVLPRLTRLAARLAEVELRVLREADRADIGEDVGATNTPAWWAHMTGHRIPVARAAAHLAEQLDTGHEPTRTAKAAGRVNTEQARVIIAAVEALPADLIGAALVADAEVHLVALADLDGQSRLDPKALRIAGRKILEVLAPDLAEEHEKNQLEAEERQAAASASFTMRPDGHGSMLGRFKVPLLAGEILAKHLNAIAAPRHQRAGDGKAADRVARPLRWG